jgi:flagellar hook protein FlgE
MSFSIDPSILNAAALRLSVVGNNISNSGVTGYQGAGFSDILANTSSSTSSNGLRIQGARQLFSQGTVQSSTNSLDMAINGQGFYRLYRPSDSSYAYTRDGSFNLDKNGYITNPTGDLLQGYGVDKSGNVSVGLPQNIKVDTSNSPPMQTTTAKMNVMLDSRLPAISSSTAFNPSDATTYTNTTISTVYDKLGTAHNLQSYFVKTGQNNWDLYTTIDNTASNPSTVPNPDSPNNGSNVTFGGNTKIDLTVTMSDVLKSPLTLGAFTTALDNASSAQGVTIDSYVNELSNNIVQKYTGNTTDQASIRTFLSSAATQFKDSGYVTVADFNSAVKAFFNDFSKAISAVLATSTAAPATSTAAPATSLSLTFSTAQTKFQPVAALSFSQSGDLNGFNQYASSGNLIKVNPKAGALDAVSSNQPILLTSKYNDNSGTATNPNNPSDANPYLTKTNSSVVLDISKTLQYASDFLASTQQDGYPTGQFQGVTVDKNGVLNANYSSGESRIVGQVVLATFPSSTNLALDRNNQFVATSASGTAIINQPGQGGAGQIVGSSIETSNVDLTSEMIKLISAQRTYQANSEVVKRQDQIMQTIIGIGQ